MNKIFSVEALAKAGNTTARTIRLYVDKGLLETTRVGRTMCFSEEASAQLAKIQRAKRLGFSLDEIKIYRRGKKPAALKKSITRIEKLQSDAAAEIADIEQLLSQINNRS